jgi:predicted NBD/HSP70 family sugar kinase
VALFAGKPIKHVTTIRERDKALIFDIIRRSGPLSRAQIQQMVDLRPATISHVTRELMSEGGIREAGLSDNPTGRKQILLEMNRDAGVILAVDCDAENIMVGALNYVPAFIHPIHSEKTDLLHGAEGLVAQMFRCVREMMNAAGIAQSSILGIGVGDPGMVDTQSGLSVMAATIDFWRNIPLRQLFEQEFGVRCVVVNNTRSRTIAEQMLGAGERSDDLIFVQYGRGIGAGVVSGGRMIQGCSWAAGEFGHIHVSENGPPCKCGSFGCIEALADIGAMEARLKKAVISGGFSVCVKMAGGDIDRITGWHVLEAARLGDKMSIVIAEEMAECLGRGIANLINLFNPSLILLDKRLALAGDLVLDQVNRTVKRQALAYSVQSVSCRFSSLEDANLLGAALVVLEDKFEVPTVKPRLFGADRHAEKDPEISHQRLVSDAPIF